MPALRIPLVAALAAAASLAAVAPAASASTATHYSVPRTLTALPSWMIAGGPAVTSGQCSTTISGEAGSTAGTESHVCLGAGLSFIGPAIGQIATVIGPTIISPGFTGTVVVSAGSVTVGS
jgi:hypothetical protein